MLRLESNVETERGATVKRARLKGPFGSGLYSGKKIFPEWENILFFCLRKKQKPLEKPWVRMVTISIFPSQKRDGKSDGLTRDGSQIQDIFLSRNAGDAPSKVRIYWLRPKIA